MTQQRKPASRGKKKKGGARPPSQRQLRAGELVRRALAEILARGEVRDPDLAGRSITVSEVRMSPDMRHAVCFVSPLGGGDGSAVVKALRRSQGYLRGELAREITFKFMPSLLFEEDKSFDKAAELDRLLYSPEVARDLERNTGYGDGAFDDDGPEGEDDEDEDDDAPGGVS
ncbi:MAG: 30S ribosome-binding factor RbfA [Parvibaculaceae bacterium]|nr:30S ribosome-binding factor RbfA [Parvibaculaceae bacterium]